MRKTSFQFIRVRGFTLLEVLVALIILAIGFLGFSGMSIMMAKGGRVSQNMNEAATLIQTSIEDLTGVNYNDLGTDSALPAPNGLSGGVIRTDPSLLNGNGQEIGTGTGPYRYYRHVVICDETMDIPAGSNPTYCGSNVNNTLRPPELACPASLGLLAGREKLIRVVVAWTDQSGKCFHRHTDSLVFQ